MDIKNALEAVNSKIEVILDKRGPLLSKLYRSSMLQEGKRLRARVLFICSGKISPDSVKLATAIELLHAATLIHDDILDNSKLRRGRPALYRKWEIPLSLLYGDYVFCEAFKLVSELESPLIFKEMTAALSEVLEGEMLEQYRMKDTSLTGKEYMSIIEKKSGVLFGASCRLGARIRGLSNDSLKMAYQFGLNVGKAYQILDDCCDYLETGKTEKDFNDIREGVITLPLIHLLRKCSQEETNFVESTIKKPNMDEKDIRDITGLMAKHEAIEDALENANRIVSHARKLVPGPIAQELNEDFDVLSWIEQRIDYARKKYRDSRRRVCRNGRPEPALRI